MSVELTKGEERLLEQVLTGDLSVLDQAIQHASAQNPKFRRTLVELTKMQSDFEQALQREDSDFVAARLVNQAIALLVSRWRRTCPPVSPTPIS